MFAENVKNSIPALLTSADDIIPVDSIPACGRLGVINSMKKTPSPRLLHAQVQC